MEEKKNKKYAIDELSRNLKFQYENQAITINNEKDLLKYISKINILKLNKKYDKNFINFYYK